MKGAREYYDLIQQGYRMDVGKLRKLKLEYQWNGGDSEAFIHDHFVFVTSTHARGKCFKIYLIDKYETDQDIKNNAFEVYGVVAGHPGWTEEYGWIKKGKWVKSALSYLRGLEKEINKIKEAEELQIKNKQKEKNKLIEEKVNTFNAMF